MMQRTLVAVFTLVASLAAGACGGASSGGGGIVTPPPNNRPTASQYVNPVLNADFPDPGVVKASDGSYYAYATQTSGRRIQVSHSTDLATWSTATEALPAKPSWASQSQNFWAPDVSYHTDVSAGPYVMYFAAQIDADKRVTPSDGFCVGMATAATPAGPFTDVGHPVVCGPGATVIDPQGFDDPQTGKRYLYWGSDHAPIEAQELAPDRASFVPGSSPTPVVVTRNQGYESLVEAPWVTYRQDQGYYYLFYSGNNCCGNVDRVHYAVMVARAKSPLGPFEVLRGADGSATPVLQFSANWLAPGHNSVVRLANGDDWMLYHAVSPDTPYLLPGNTDVSRRPLLLDKITYQNGWPVVGAGGAPTSTPQTKPAVP